MSLTFNQSVSCCAAESSASLDNVDNAAARFLNLNVRSLHRAAVESKLDNIENAWDSMKDLRCLHPKSPCPSDVAAASAAFISKMSHKSDS